MNTGFLSRHWLMLVLYILMQEAARYAKHDFPYPLHPQTQFSTSGTSSDPIFRLMELRHRRHSSDPIASELSQLLSITGIYVYEAIHVSDDETLDVVRGLELPLRAKTVGS